MIPNSFYIAQTIRTKMGPVLFNFYVNTLEETLPSGEFNCRVTGVYLHAFPGNLKLVQIRSFEELDQDGREIAWGMLEKCKKIMPQERPAEVEQFKVRFAQVDRYIQGAIAKKSGQPWRM